MKLEEITKLETVTAEQLLNFTINHYNLGNRGVGKIQCSYAAGCSIGVFMTKAQAEEADNANPVLIAHDLKDAGLLPDSLKGIHRDILRWVQSLHDCEDNWTYTGLSDYGARNVDAIIKIHNLNASLINIPQ